MNFLAALPAFTFGVMVLLVIVILGFGVLIGYCLIVIWRLIFGDDDHHDNFLT